MTHDIPQPSGAPIPNLQRSLGRRRRPQAQPTAAAEPTTGQNAPATTTRSQPRTPGEYAQRDLAPSRPEPDPRPRHEPPRSQPATSSARTPRRQVTFTLPIELAQTLGDFARTRRLTRAAVIFQAITQTREDLPARFTVAPDAGEEQLFSEAPTADGSTPTPRVTTHAQMAQQDLETLDRMRRESGAPDRSAYIEAALTLWFNRTKQ